MSHSAAQAAAIILTAAVCTFATRALPFALFGGKKGMPQIIGYLGKHLPGAIIAVLVVYCLKGITASHWTQSGAQIFSVAVVAVLHIWKGNTLVSIAGGTIVHMLLVNLLL
jgi:branched-subunit amino acid transport protein AzlD